MADQKLLTIQGLNNAQIYESEMGLRLVMNAIVINIRKRNKTVNDGFISMHDIITLFSNDVEGFVEWYSERQHFFVYSKSLTSIRTFLH